MDDRKKSTINLLYFHQIKRAESVINCFLGIAWVVCVTLNLIYIYTGNIADYMNHNSYLPLISFSFVAVQIFYVCEAWANALMITLFESLQFDDYNKKFSGKNYFNQLKKEKKAQQKKVDQKKGDSGGLVQEEGKKLLKKASLQSNPLSSRKSSKMNHEYSKSGQGAGDQWSWRDILCCRCLTNRSNQSNRKEGRKGKKRGSRQKEKNRKHGNKKNHGIKQQLQ